MSIAVALWIDDADYIDDRSEEALDYLLTMLERLGIRATFKLAGEKARVLEQHRRTDLINKLRTHDLCFHSDLHSFHPTVIEYTEPLSFHDGAAAFDARDMHGFHDMRRIFGKELVGYGQPGEAWTPDVFPVLKQQGADVNLDDHFILDVDGMAFSYGGVLNFNHVRRILRYDYHNEAGLDDANREFDRLAEQDFGRDYPEEVRLFSVFYHPSEFFSAEFLGDYYNFRDGKNHAYDAEGRFIGYTMPPGFDIETEHRYIDLVGQFLQHMLSRGARFVTASDLRNMQIRRRRFIEIDDIRAMAASYAENGISFFDIGGEYVSASEGFVLLAQMLSEKPLHPYLLYGPEERGVSVIGSSGIITRAQAAAAMAEHDFIYGYPQMKSLYHVDDSILTPYDLCATAAVMVSRNLEECEIVRGTLLSEQSVCHHSNWSRRWLFGDNFHVPNTYEKTKLQCWTLKPIRY